MKVNVSELLDAAALENENFYPGKKLIRKYVQHGDHKSHCMVMDWLERDLMRVTLTAGVTGHLPDAKELRLYPVSFQAPTYMDIEMRDAPIVEKEDDDEEDGETSSSSGKGGGKKPHMKKREETLSAMDAFSRKAEGAVSLLGEIKKFVIMGREIAKESYAQAFENLKVQVAQTKIMVMDLMKDVSNIMQKATPGGGLAARGDETVKYKYDAERNGPMFGGLTPT